MAKNNMPLIIGGAVVVGGAAYLFYRSTRPVVDTGVGMTQSPLKSAANAACLAAAMASGVPAPLATLSCAAGGAIAKPLAQAAVKTAKAVKKVVGKNKKTIALGIATGGVHTTTKLAIKAIKKLPAPVKKVGKISALTIATGGIYPQVKLAGKVLKKVVPKSVQKVAGKILGKPVKLAGKVVGAPVKAVKKIGKWLGLGDADMDLALYAHNGLAGVGPKRRARVRIAPRNSLADAGCAGGDDCCETLRGHMSGIQFYERGLTNFQGL